MTGELARFDARNVKADVRKALEQQAVIVVGPGCDRIGYDSDGSAPWREVETRIAKILSVISPSAGDEAAAESAGDVNPSADGDQDRRFLLELFRSKLSDPRRSDELLLEDLGDGPAAAADDESRPTGLDAARTELATLILSALIDCTRALGEAIATGTVPVTNWETVAAPRTAATTAAQAGGRRLSSRQGAAEALRQASALAGLLKQWTDDEDGAPRLPERLAVSARDVRRTRASLWALKIDAIADATGRLADQCLDPSTGGHCVPFTGATIEWLADLLWHLIVCDSGVPSSQSELTFHLNLRDEQGRSATVRTFTRAYPGELRGDPGEGKREDSITERLRCGLTGCEEARDWRHVIDQPRIKVAAMLAAVLREQWDLIEEGRAAGTRRTAVYAPVALSSTYNLVLERQVLEQTRDGEVLHVAVPAWFGDRLDWLWGTYTRSDELLTSRYMTCDKAEGGGLDWKLWRYSDVEQSGPLIMKMSGCPLFQLPEGITADALFGPETIHEDAPVRIASLLSEHDLLGAIMVLKAPADGGTTAEFVLKLGQLLAWEKRNWIFLGDRFPDWIPRIRLLFHAQSRFTSAAARSRLAHLALDRSFDWPERALLEALDVTPVEGDLERLGSLPGAATATNTPFWQGVSARLKELGT